MTDQPKPSRQADAAAPASASVASIATPAVSNRARRPKILFLVTEDWYFRSHRLPIARAAQHAGYDVVVATRVTEDGPLIAAEGFRVIPLSWRRGGRDIGTEWRAVREITAVYRREAPDLVHHVSMKPILHGSLAAWMAGVPRIINAPTGLGHIFIGRGIKAVVFRWFFTALLGWLVNRPGSWVIMQNADDLEALQTAGVVRSAPVALIAGSGVDLKAFRPAPRPPTWENAPAPVAVMVGRMLLDKGIGDLAEAVRILRTRGVAIDLRLVGPLDPENPAAVAATTLDGWRQEGLLTWLGPTRNVASVLAEADIGVLPSYREGLPKALLEAAACGLPMVATDVPGCRDICIHEETGLLCPARDAAGLADALARLAGDPGLRARLGAAARRLVERRFSDRAVAEQTMALYRAMLSEVEST